MATEVEGSCWVRHTYTYAACCDSEHACSLRIRPLPFKKRWFSPHWQLKASRRGWWATPSLHAAARSIQSERRGWRLLMNYNPSPHHAGVRFLRASLAPNFLLQHAGFFAAAAQARRQAGMGVVVVGFQLSRAEEETVYIRQRREKMDGYVHDHACVRTGQYRCHRTKQCIICVYERSTGNELYYRQSVANQQTHIFYTLDALLAFEKRILMTPHSCVNQATKNPMAHTKYRVFC